MDNMPAVTGQNRKFIIFSLQGSLYALDLAQVAEVGAPPLLSPIPLAPVCYSGALNFHGNIVAVMDLALFLGLSGVTRPEKIIFLHRDVASLAFLVDTIIRIVSEGEVTFSTPPDSCFAAAKVCMSDGEAIQLDLETIVKEAVKCMRKHE